MSDARTPGHVLWDAIALYFEGMPDWHGLSARAQIAAEDAARDLRVPRVFDEDEGSDDEDPEDGRASALAWIFKAP
jgi:hypothetical protein